MVIITEKPTQRAVGHTYYVTRHSNALELLDIVANLLENGGFEDDPYNFDNDPKFKVMIIIEEKM